MASGTLYTYPENFRAYKALIAAQCSGANVKIADNFVFGKTNKSKGFLKKFPLGKVPAFESSKGECLTESNAIAYYVANEQLRGNTDLERAEVIQWFGFADSEILPASCAWVFPLLGIMPYNEEVVNNAKVDVKNALKALNSHLSTKTYLVGERLTLADISVAMTLLNLYQHVLDPKTRKPFQNVNRWFQTVIYQPESIAVIGSFELCDTKPTEAAEAAEPDEGAEPVSSNPFDAMPKGTFDMDDFKRFYSNQDESKSIPYFWEKFDPKNYSIWLGEYKYNDELTKVFMSCNLISGMFQRLDKMRKATFASSCLFGTDNDSGISGIWVWRGQDLAFSLSPDWQVDYESYNWTKLDPTKEETRDLVKQYFSWTGTDKKGRHFNQGKIFK